MDVIQSNDQFRNGYVFSPEEVLSVVSVEYKIFLKDAGYVDLDLTANLFVCAGMLMPDDVVREKARNGDIDYVVNEIGLVSKVTQNDGKRLINSLGGVLLTTGLMRRLFIPKVKTHKDDTLPKSTLKELLFYQEFVEDRIYKGSRTEILEDDRIVIGGAERKIVLPESAGDFDFEHLNDYGYPTKVHKRKRIRSSYYTPPFRHSDEGSVVTSGGGKHIDLFLDNYSQHAISSVGIRFAKFFRENIDE